MLVDVKVVVVCCCNDWSTVIIGGFGDGDATAPPPAVLSAMENEFWIGNFFTYKFMFAIRHELGFSRCRGKYVGVQNKKRDAWGDMDGTRWREEELCGLSTVHVRMSGSGQRWALFEKLR